MIWDVESSTEIECSCLVSRLDLSCFHTFFLATLLHRDILSYLSTVAKKTDGRGSKPFENLPDHGINTGTDITKL